LPAEDMVPPGDFVALADVIRAVVTDPARMARMSARNLARAQEYREDALCARRTAFYRTLRERTEAWAERDGVRQESGEVHHDGSVGFSLRTVRARIILWEGRRLKPTLPLPLPPDNS